MSETYTTFPIQNQSIWNMYKKQVDCFWRAEEVDLSSDIESWNKLTEQERHYICMILAFFASSDGIVLENLACRFMMDVKLSEARAFYGFQIAMENIHSEMYSLLIDTYIKDPEYKLTLFHAMDHFPCIGKKTNWALKWITNSSSFATRLVAFACIEGIFFSGAFCSIYWLKSRGIMPGLTFSNELISRDEALHTEFAILLYKLEPALSITLFFEIVKEAVEIEKEFINDVLQCRLIGMNAPAMSTYIEFVADRLCIQMGYSPIYHSNNPFSFMELISLEGKTNFFEKRVGEYGMADTTKTTTTMFTSDF